MFHDNNLNHRLMQGRLGVYDKYRTGNSVLDSDLVGINNQNIRITHHGGKLQQDRMIADKLRSFKSALYRSYQGADIKKINSSSDEPIRVLINPNQLKQDYDDKIISVAYEHNLSTGDIFEWIGTNTHWLIYLQDLTELAYFRGDIRKCSHEIAWEDEGGLHKTYVAIRGPIETKINSSQGHKINIDTPNYSLNILMPKTDEAVKYFQRYSKFYLSSDNEYKICWRVETVDWLSTPGILAINAVEYYKNETEDDVDNGIVGGLIVEPVNPNPSYVNCTIIGESFIKPKKEYIFEYQGNASGDWSVDKQIPVKLVPDGKNVKVKWMSTSSGQFDLYYAGVYKKTIVVESLF